ncbi:MAG: hypothetical protein KBA54_01270 [Candidatus Cloacimonetes bacterium]|nr:hypothetical protein [Candidatus Cloacimonadota bacterium]
MKQHWLIWIPRILAILLGIFMFLFSLDVFGGGESIWRKLLGLLIHNIPVIILFLALWLTWKRPLITALLFLALGVAITLYFRMYEKDWRAFIAISGIPLLCAILFAASHYLTKKST